MSVPLKKWDIIRVYRPDLLQPHDKFCICICPSRMWFLYINSSPPSFRKKREFAISVSNFEVNCLQKAESFIDTATIISDLPSAQLMQAIGDDGRRHGPLPPSLRKVICSAVGRHGAFNDEQLAAILE